MKRFAILCSLILLYLTSFVVITKDSFGKQITPNIDPQMYTNSSVKYSDWNQNITVGMDGSLLIVEEMTFWLPAGSYGFAYRDLLYKGFHDVSSWSIISGPGAPSVTSHKMEKESGYVKFYWEWSRHSVIEGTTYTFILTYNVSSAMDLRGNRDRVYWNVIGGEFDYWIYDIDTTVIFPQEFNESDVRSTTYYQGSGPGDDEGTVTTIDNKTAVVFHQDSVAPLQSYTVDADAPPSGIDMPFSIRVYLNQSWIIVVLMGFVPIFLFFIIAFLVKGIDPRVKAIPTLNEVAMKKCAQCGYKDNRKIKFCSQCGEEMKTITEIGPPNNLTPAEVGTLLDEKFDKIDFVAEFFYLAEKGYLKIVQLEDDDEIYFQRTEKNTQYGYLSKFDQEILEFVERYSYESIWYRTEGKKVNEVPVEVTSLSSIKSHIQSLWTHKKDIYKKLSGGETKYFEANPDRIRSRYFGLALFLGIGLSFLAYVIGEWFFISNLKLGIIGIAIASLIGLILSQFMPKLTKSGAKLKASWQSYLQLIRGQMIGFPDPYEQFSFSMDHFSFLLIDPKFDLPNHLKHISKKIRSQPPPGNYHFVTPYWYYYPYIHYPRRGIIGQRPISGFDRMGQGFSTAVDGISNLAESLPAAISNLAEGLTNAISDMSESFTPPSSSGGSSGFGGGFSGGGGGGGGGGIG
ncbi:MAG: DUF2207 domain-containing protein [Asgard group archaeon]|nr:DUF2207 domain-containing protein [Asgard group archaeon]